MADRDRDQQMARAYQDGSSLRQVAARFGVSTKAVRGALSRTATPARRQGRVRTVDEAAVVALHVEGRTQAEIADELGVHPVTVRRVYARHGLDGRAEPARRRQLVDRDQVRMLLADLGNQSEVGRQLGVSYQTIHRIAHGR